MQRRSDKLAAMKANNKKYCNWYSILYAYRVFRNEGQLWQVLKYGILNILYSMTGYPYTSCYVSTGCPKVDMIVKIQIY